MTASVGALVSGVLAGAVAVLWTWRPGVAPQVLRRCRSDPPPAANPAAGSSAQGHRRGAARAPLAASALAGLAVLVVVGGPAGLAGAVAVAVLGPRLLARLEPEAARRDRERLVADLPLALDLLAACLAGGASLPRAASVVADAVGGPVGRRLQRVGAALDLGSPAEEAWAGLVGGGATRPDDDPMAPVARTLARASRGGAPVVTAVERLASEARADLRARGEQAARRAGVLAVGPLGLCFLPAFVLIGVVPVVAGLVGPLLSSL